MLMLQARGTGGAGGGNPAWQRALRTHPIHPAGDHEQLDNHAEVVMHDFAACLLAELERWMLTASPAMVDLSGGCGAGWWMAG